MYHVRYISPDPPKGELLDAGGFLYEMDHELYVQPVARKIFSSWFVRDHSAEELEACIKSDPPSEGWRFYFNTPPSDSVREQIEQMLEEILARKRGTKDGRRQSA